MRRSTDLVLAIALAGAAVACDSRPATQSAPVQSEPAPPPQARPLEPAPGPTPGPEEVAQSNTAFQVTEDVDLDPTLGPAAAMAQIERRSRPDDGQGRTFAVLSATAQGTPEGKLRVSMRISFEEPGAAELVFRPTGEVLWSGKVVPGPPSTNPYAGKGLVVMVADAQGRDHVIDGSRGISSIFDGLVPDMKTTVGAMWPEGEERQVSFIHSTCGCPVKVKVRRAGTRTVRTPDQQVLFPDDPQVLASINQLMGW